VVGTAAMVASYGVLMLSGADKSQSRWFEHAAGRRSWLPPCMLRAGAHPCCWGP